MRCLNEGKENCEPGGKRAKQASNKTVRAYCVNCDNSTSSTTDQNTADENLRKKHCLNEGKENCEPGGKQAKNKQFYAYCVNCDNSKSSTTDQNTANENLRKKRCLNEGKENCEPGGKQAKQKKLCYAFCLNCGPSIEPVSLLRGSCAVLLYGYQR